MEATTKQESWLAGYDAALDMMRSILITTDRPKNIERRDWNLARKYLLLEAQNRTNRREFGEAAGRIPHADQEPPTMSQREARQALEEGRTVRLTYKSSHHLIGIATIDAKIMDVRSTRLRGRWEMDVNLVRAIGGGAKHIAADAFTIRSEDLR